MTVRARTSRRPLSSNRGLAALWQHGDGLFRMAVQLALRPQGSTTHDFRGYMGRIAQGAVRVGDRVLVAPGGGESTVTDILTPAGPAQEATVGQSVTLSLADDIDAGRGFTLADAAHPPATAREVTAALCWLDTAPQDPRAPYLMRIGTRTVAARVDVPESRLDIHTLERVAGGAPLQANDIGEVRIRLQDDIAFDPYGACKAMGAFIIVDSRTNATVAAGMIDHRL